MKINNKNIVLCITGGIAAYKAASLASYLKKKGANVYAVMTKNSTKFITPLTIKTITRNKVTIDMFDESDFIPHISLSDLADIIIVAPATANIIAKVANGIADDMVSTILLSSNAKKIIIPAMNTNMYLNKITQENIKKIIENNYNVMDPEDGEMACGTVGPGRFPEIIKIYDYIIDKISKKNNGFNNKNILITIGGTIEDIDPVRYVSNRSSGKMGFSLAEKLYEFGANIKIIYGNVSDIVLNDFRLKYPNIKYKKIRNAENLKKAVLKEEKNFDIYIMAAAVADYTIDYNDNKIKKNNNDLTIKLKRTDDILKCLKKRDNAVYIGFAAESKNLLENAEKKLKEKQIDIIIANLIKGEKSAIGNNNAEVFILNRWNNNKIKIDYNDKKIISEKIIEKLSEILKINNKI